MAQTAGSLKPVHRASQEGLGTGGQVLGAGFSHPPPPPHRPMARPTMCPCSRSFGPASPAQTSRSGTKVKITTGALPFTVDGASGMTVSGPGARLLLLLLLRAATARVQAVQRRLHGRRRTERWKMSVAARLPAGCGGHHVAALPQPVYMRPATCCAALAMDAAHGTRRQDRAQLCDKCGGHLWNLQACCQDGQRGSEQRR